MCYIFQIIQSNFTISNLCASARPRTRLRLKKSSTRERPACRAPQLDSPPLPAVAAPRPPAHRVFAFLYIFQFKNKMGLFSVSLCVLNLKIMEW